MSIKESRLETSLVVPVTPEFIGRRIYLFRGQKVMLDSDLAELYQVPTTRLNEQVKRNSSRFPTDFMFRLVKAEARSLTSQIAISKKGRGGRRHLPYVFTELGVAMLSSVLRSESAIQMNVYIMRVFVKLRELLATHSDLAKKIEELEEKQKSHSGNLAELNLAVAKLIEANTPKKGVIGFRA